MLKPFPIEDLHAEIRQFVEYLLEVNSLTMDAGLTYNGNPTWDLDPEEVDISTLGITEALEELYHIIFNADGKDSFPHRDDIAHAIGPLLSAIPDSDLDGNSSGIFDEESLAKRLLWQGVALGKVRSIFSGDTYDPSLAVKSVKNLANTTEQTVRNALSKKSSVLTSYKTPSGIVRIPPDSAFEWISSRRNFVPRPIPIHVHDEENFGQYDRYEHPVRYLKAALHWNVGSTEKIINRLGVTTEELQNLFDNYIPKNDAVIKALAEVLETDRDQLIEKWPYWKD